MREVEAHRYHKLLKGQLVGELGIKFVAGCVKHCYRQPPIHELVEGEGRVLGCHVAGGGRLERTVGEPVLSENEAGARCVETGCHDFGHFRHVNTFEAAGDFEQWLG